MKHPTRSLSVHLPKGDLIAIPDLSGMQVACREGCLWITLDGDPRDIVLEPGQAFTGSEHRRALVHALAAACLTIRPAIAQALVLPALLPLLRPQRAAC